MQHKCTVIAEQYVIKCVKNDILRLNVKGYNTPECTVHVTNSIASFLQYRDSGERERDGYWLLVTGV